MPEWSSVSFYKSSTRHWPKLNNSEIGLLACFVCTFYVSCFTTFHGLSRHELPLCVKYVTENEVWPCLSPCCWGVGMSLGQTKQEVLDCIYPVPMVGWWAWVLSSADVPQGVGKCSLRRGRPKLRFLTSGVQLQLETTQRSWEGRVGGPWACNEEPWARSSQTPWHPDTAGSRGVGNGVGSVGWGALCKGEGRVGELRLSSSAIVLSTVVIGSGEGFLWET